MVREIYSIKIVAHKQSFTYMKIRKKKRKLNKQIYAVK